MFDRGYTLLELLVTLAIVTLLAAVGVPSWRTMSSDAEVSGVTSNYLHAFNSGRYAAVVAHRPVSICDLDAGGNCTGRWRNRLTVFYDDNNDGKLADAGDIIDAVGVNTPHGVDITLRAFGKTRYLHLKRSGHYRQNGTFRICPRRGTGGRNIVINVTGRARTEPTSCR